MFYKLSSSKFNFICKHILILYEQRAFSNMFKLKIPKLAIYIKVRKIKIVLRISRYSTTFSAVFCIFHSLVYKLYE